MTKQILSAAQKNIILIGFMGVGKTTVSAKLGPMLRRKTVDTDQLISERLQMSIPEIFERRGEPFFRSVEHALLSELQPLSGLIIACGGGVVLRADNRNLLRRMGTVVLLTAKAETIYRRISMRTDLPLLRGHMTLSHIQSMQNKRDRLYRETADLTLATDGQSPAAICAEIAALIRP